jgi:hypothetical protein
MIMYTPLPLEAVLEGMEDMKDDLSEISLNGVRLQVKMLSQNEAQVVRLISPDPQQYLNPAYAPGSYIHFNPGN